MKTIKLICLIIILSITAVRAQSNEVRIKDYARTNVFLRDSLMNISDSLKRDTTILCKIQDYNILYTYSIRKIGDNYIFTQLYREKQFTNYKAITGTMYFFGVYSAIVGHKYIKEDKVLHFAAGEIAGGAGYTIAKALKLKHPILWGIGTGILVGAGKEGYDKISGKGVPSFKDGLWTGVGSVFGSFTMKIIIP